MRSGAAPTQFDQLEHTGKGKSDAITKVMNAMGSVGAVRYRIEAEKYRAEAARLWWDQLAQIESQNQSSLAIPAPLNFLFLKASIQAKSAGIFTVLG